MSLALDRIPRPPEVELGPEAEPMDLFYLVMRNNSLPLQTRMRAAERIADIVYPKKQAIAVLPAGGDLGLQLEVGSRSQEGPYEARRPFARGGSSGSRRKGEGCAERRGRSLRTEGPAKARKARCRLEDEGIA
jgi:hypothetical protein